MLDNRNTDKLIEIANNSDTPSATRVSACSLLHRLSAMPAKELLAILQETIDDERTKCAVQVKAMDLIDKINNSTGQEPELRSEDVEDVTTSLLEKYLVCPDDSAKS